MKDFKKPGSFGGKRGGNNFSRPHSGRPSFGAHHQSNRGQNERFERAQMFQAICANCGKQCEVPFRPSGERPVYCKDCFGKQSRTQPGSFSKKDFGGRTHSQSRPARQEVRDGRIDDIKRQLDAMNVKLDQLLNASRPISLPTQQSLVVEARTTKGMKQAKVSRGAKKKSFSKK